MQAISHAWISSLVPVICRRKTATQNQISHNAMKPAVMGSSLVLETIPGFSTGIARAEMHAPTAPAASKAWKQRTLAEAADGSNPRARVVVGPRVVEVTVDANVNSQRDMIRKERMREDTNR